MPNFLRGDFAPFAFQPKGGANTILNIKSQNADFTALLFDVTSTGSGGVRARISGLLDCKGTVNADFDLDQPPYGTPPTLLPGTLGIGSYYFSQPNNKFIQIPCIIEKVHYESAVESEVKYSFDFSIASNAGLLVYPAT